MKQWQISELESRDMRDIFNKNILFHFCDEVADRVEKWLEAIGVSNTARFEDFCEIPPRKAVAPT